MLGSDTDSAGRTATANAEILATVTLGALVEAFFMFGPLLCLIGALAGEEDEPICFSASLRLQLVTLASARWADDSACGFQYLFSCGRH